MKNGIGNEGGMRKAALLAGVLLCFVLVLAAFLRDRSMVAFGSEESDEFAWTEAIAGGGTDSAQTKAAVGNETETETEGEDMVSDLQGIAGMVLTDDMLKELNGMSAEETEEYIEMLQKVLLNPDFQSLFEYEEVRDLAVTLVKNALQFSSDDPETTNKILETMGVDRRLIILFFAVLQGWQENKDVSNKALEFLATEQGRMLAKMMLESIDQQTIANAVGNLDNPIPLKTETEPETK